MTYFGKISTDLVMKSSKVIHELTTQDILRRVLEIFEVPPAFVSVLKSLSNCQDSPKLRHWVSVSRCLLRSKIQTLDPEPRFVAHFYVDSLAPSRIMEIHAFRAMEIVLEDKMAHGGDFAWDDGGALFPPTFNLWKVGTIQPTAPLTGVRIQLVQDLLTIKANGSRVSLSRDGSNVQVSGSLSFTPPLLATSQAGDFVVPIDVSGLADAYHSHAPVVRGRSANMKWIKVFGEAVSLLHTQNPDTARDCARLCPAVLALHTGGASYGSSSPQELMGLIFLPGVDDAYDLAECLLHESLHQKLYRVEEGSPLFMDGKDEEEIYYSPWRSDGRPLRMLVHGAYVFAGVSHYWKTNYERLTYPEDRDNAGFHCYYRAKQAEAAIAIVDKHDRRTEMGRKVSEIIHEGIDDALCGLTVPASVQAEANVRLEQHLSRFGRLVR